MRRSRSKLHLFNSLAPICPVGTYCNTTIKSLNDLRVQVLISVCTLRLQLLLIRPRAPLKLLDAALSLSAQDALLALELAHADGGQDGGAVVLGLGVVRLVDGDRGVDVLGGVDLLLDDGLDVLVDVVVDVLAGGGGGDGGAVGRLVGGGCVLEAGGFRVELGADVLLVAVVDGLVLDGEDVVGVLLGAGGVRLDGKRVVMRCLQGLLGLDGLDDSMVVVLVDFLVEGAGDVLVLVGPDLLVGDGLLHRLVYGGGVLAIVGDEVGNGLLSFLHGCGGM